MIKSIGIRAHDFGKFNSRILAEKIQEEGLMSAQLALNKAIIGIDDLSIDLEDEKLLQIGADFKESGVSIAVLGCYLNYGHPNLAVRKENEEIFKRHIRYAKLLNARTVGTETGSLSKDYTYHQNNHGEEAYKTFARSLSNVLEVAEENNVTIAIEGVASHIINTNQKMKRILSDMQSKYLKVIFDHVNLLTNMNYKQDEDVLKEGFELFGDDIWIIHSKDYTVNQNKIQEVAHGTGVYNFKCLVEQVSSASQPIDILLENADINNIQNIFKLFR